MGGAGSPMANGIEPALGLRNTLSQYPFINAETDDQNCRELLTIFPTRQEVLTYYHICRAIVFPLSPLIGDIDHFECCLTDYLERVRGTGVTLETSPERGNARQIVLLLATLATGAQVQQDCILSLCYDRQTTTADMPFIDGGNADSNEPLDFRNSMWQVAKVGPWPCRETIFQCSHRPSRAY
ncbi:hypothetical protein B0J12DRAFT_640941 [Macrophomina phaseolina]|uniref:Uncharacterized protein n=1 Tax=Macrophomina phaseolina TaxID=35725 RepID=A0ABQ8GWF3_9PEZI|nr:hypothetical protein B0J12DRAFT_640941 [Macrophomina phaseolina]